MYLLQPRTSAWGWNLSLSLASKDHSWEGPPKLEVKERGKEEGWVRRMGKGRRAVENKGGEGRTEGKKEGEAQSTLQAHRLLWQDTRPGV